MLDIKNIRTHSNEMVEALSKRGIDARHIMDNILALDEQRRNTQTKLDQTLASLNSISKDIGILFRENKTEEANALKKQTGDLKEDIKTLQDQLQALEKQVLEQIIELPNTPHQLVKAGKTAEDNEQVKIWGTPRPFDESLKPHWEIAETHNIIDFEMGAKVSGSGFPFYVGKGARLQRALINMFLDHNTKAGYVEYQAPLLVNEASGYGTGQLPDKEGQMYHITEDNLYAIPTAEVPLTNIYRNTIVDGEKLPIRLTGYTPCFRREAGSHGKDVRGLNRLHQFDKVEIVCIDKPERSYARLEEMVAHVEVLLQQLELPYRILRLCGGDMGFTSAMTYDFEVYSAAQKRWLEVSSVSNFETFQANRLQLRFRGEDKKTQFCHTLNGSSLALPRIVACLLENAQTENDVELPKALQTYTGFARFSDS
ncbi:MAG: serine--tRNA ligase [Cryomorphaceae bacterium]|nr:serine--tRNA ligase [Cryomorphaceae bacterium]